MLLVALYAGGPTLRADTHADVVDLFASMAAALSDDNAAGFMAAFDREMPDYDKLKTQIAAMLEEAVVGSDIEPIKDEGDDSRRSVDLDWYLEIRSRVPDGPLVRRRQVVHCDLRKEKKHWKVISIAPLAFFAAAKFDKAGQ